MAMTGGGFHETLSTVAWPTGEFGGMGLEGAVRLGYRKELEIIGVGYRAEATSPTSLRLALGFSHPVVMTAPEGITFECPSQTRVIVRGIDKEIVGQVAANIRSIRKPEPYKGKGVRYLGEKVVRKAGKTGKK
jgi:large subunit ribosomal protein L6